jgi:hypothetical protein
MWEKYYLEANAVLYVIDSVDIGRLDEAKLAYGKYIDYNIATVSWCGGWATPLTAESYLCYCYYFVCCWI